MKNRSASGGVSRAHQRGFSMVEVLITFFILSIGLLGLAALQVKAVQYNQAAYMRSQALIAGNAMLDMIRLNANSDANLAAYNITYAASSPTAGLTQPSKDLALWRSFLATSMPDGTGKITCDIGTRICEVGVRWTDRVSNSDTVTTDELLVKSQL